MKKKNSKKPDTVKTILDSYNKDIKRHMSALSEDFQGQVSAVAEQFLGVNRKLDSLEQKLDSLEQKVDSLERKVDSLEQKVDSHTERFVGIERKLDSHTEMIGNMAMDLEIVKADIEFIKNGLRKKADNDEFVALERRVALIESRIKR